MPAPKFDEIEITIDPETGLIKSTTPKISAANHSSADLFFELLARMTGGETRRERRTKSGHTHAHAHEHDHTKAS